MKRKLTLVVCVIALFALIFTLASCGEITNDEKNHTHTYAQEWTSTAAGHWYAATCGCQGESSNYGAHVDKDDDGVCDTCEYQICEHKFESVWDNDKENHWKNPTCGCKVVDKMGAHVDANKDGKCDTCEYVVCAHTFATTWSSDATSHWYAATCGCSVVDKKVDHIDTVLDGKCDVCAYVICAHIDQAGGVSGGKDGICDDCNAVVCAHTYADTWSNDEANHWKNPTCGCDIANKDVQVHVDADKDGVCDTCAYVVCSHEFATEWSSDGAYHWYAATCGCNVVDKKAEHVDEAKDGICDICNGKACEHTYADTWSSDVTGHWYAATCGCLITKDFAAHVDEAKDGICDVCEYVVCAHEYSNEWSSDADNHWKAPICGCNIANAAVAAHVDEAKDGICDTCEYVVCSHEFATEWSSDENNHWYAAICGCNVRKDEAPHSEDQVCSACGRSSEIKNAIDNLNSEAYLDVNSSVIIKNENSENSYKVYDNYVVVKDTFGNVKYFSFYGEDDNLLFVINVDEDGNITRDLYAEDVATLIDVVNYSAVYYNVRANNNEDFIKGLYDLGVNGAFDWEGNQIGFSYGFNGKEADGTFTFSYVYVEEGNYYYVEASFTVDAATNGVASANVLIKNYEDGVTIDDVTDTYVIDENATVSSTESYEITQTFGGAMDSTNAPNPYNPDDYIVDDYTITFNGTELKDGDTIEVVAGENAIFNFGADVLDMIKYNSIVASATNSNGDELPEWWSTIGSISVNNYADERPITFVANVADTYTVVVSVEGVETTFNVEVSYKAPTAIDSVVYDEFADEKVKANNWTIYFDQSLTFSAAVEAGCDPSFTATLGANAMALLTDNGDGTWTIKPVMIGDYEVTLTSTADASVTTTLTVSVVEAPAISDVISGTVSSEYSEYMTWTSGTITVVFTPASEGATEGTLTITNVGSDYNGMAFSYTTAYTYAYNSETGAIDLTYVSGDEYEIELSVANYKLCALYMWETLVLEAEAEEDPDEPVVGPTTSPFDMVISDTYGYFEEDEFTFVAGDAGKYTFFVPAGYGMLVNWSSEKCNYFDNANGTSFTLTLAAGETVSLVPQATAKGTVTITFTYEATEVEEPTVEPGLTGTYTGVDDWGNEISVVVTDTTITFQPPRSQMIEFTYEVDNGIVTLYDSEGNAITNPIAGNITIDTENNVFAVLSYNGSDYTLTKQPSQGGDDEGGLAGNYTATDDWGNSFDVVITDTTISFTPPRSPMVEWTYTYESGILTVYSGGVALTNPMMGGAEVDAENNVFSKLYNNGTEYTLTKAGAGSDDDEPVVDGGLAGTYTAADDWGNSFTVTITDTTITFQPPRSPMVEWTYTYEDGILTVYSDGVALTNPMMGGAEVDAENNVFSKLYNNGTEYTLTKAGAGSDDDEPVVDTVTELVEGDNNVSATGNDMNIVTLTATANGTYTITVGANGVVGYDYYYYLENESFTVDVEAGDVISFEINSMDYTACVIVVTVEFEEEIVIVEDPQAELKKPLSNYTYKIGEYNVGLTQNWETGVYYLEVTDTDWTIDICFTYSVTDNSDGTFTLSNLEYYQVAWEAGVDNLDTVKAAVEGQTISANLTNNAVRGNYQLNGYSFNLSRNGETGAYEANISDDTWTTDLYFTYEATDNGDGTYTIALTYTQVDWEAGSDKVDTLLAMEWVVTPVAE